MLDIVFIPDFVLLCTSNTPRISNIIHRKAHTWVATSFAYLPSTHLDRPLVCTIGPCRANSNIVTAGNTSQALLPLGAASISIAKNDEVDLWQLPKSELTTVGITYGIEYGIYSTEPDSQQHSFSSDDMAVTF